MDTARPFVDVPKRYILIALCFCTTFICYIDRVNISVAILPMADSFGWSDSTKGLILSSFFLGYLVGQLPTAWLATRVGGKIVVGAAIVWWSAFTLLTPIAAFGGLTAFVGARVAICLGEAATFPAIYNLYSKWLPPAERTRAVVIVLGGVPLGTVIGLSATGWMTSAFGWPSSFYVFGLLGAVFSVVWLLFAHAQPQSHPSISVRESDAITLALARGSKGNTHSVIPWRQLLSSSAVWALIFNHFSASWTFYVLLSWLPSYFRDTQGLSVSGAGLFSAAPWLCMFAASTTCAAIADQLIARGVSSTRVRKVTQIAGLLGSAVFLLCAPYAAGPGSALLILCLAVSALGMTWSGFAPNPLEIAPRHADILVGMTNTAGTIPGVVGVAVTGWLIDITESYDSAFYIAAFVSVLGSAVWFRWGTAEQVID